MARLDGAINDSLVFVEGGWFVLFLMISNGFKKILSQPPLSYMKKVVLLEHILAPTIKGLTTVSSALIDCEIDPEAL